MATYDVEHNIPTATTGGGGPASNRPATPPHRPDLSAFLTTLSRFQEEQEGEDDDDEEDDDDPSHTTSPATVLRELASSYSTLLPPPTNTSQSRSRRTADLDSAHETLRAMTETLLRGVEARPGASAIKGVPQEFLDGLERVRSRKALEAAGECPICGSVFAEDEYPLVVRLPCDRRHVFDLECVAGWLKVQRTCPMDRIDLIDREKKRREQIRREAMGEGTKGGGGGVAKKEEEEEEEEEEWDGMFA